jgi:hypothetical protein
LDIVKAAKEEILWIFPTTNAFIRQDKIGAIPLAIQAARERNVIVRILVPGNSLIEEKVQQLKQYCSDHIIIDVRYIEQMSETKASSREADRITSSTKSNSLSRNIIESDIAFLNLCKPDRIILIMIQIASVIVQTSITCGKLQTIEIIEN